MEALVTKIIPFSSVDGPGNRTAVFLQGCNINCKYCHNPETRKVCISCGACVEKCPAGALSMDSGKVIFDASKCVSCDTCIKTCPHDSTPKAVSMTPDSVFEVVRKQLPFIRGITISGGECMLQPEFIRELFILAKKENLGTLIDSNGTIPFSEYPDLMEVTDGVMLDIKAFSPEEHMYVTGSPNDMVLENAGFLGETGKLFEVRCVIAPDLYNCEESVRKTGKFLYPLYKLHKFRIKIIAYRPMGVRKEYSDMRVPTQEELSKYKNMLSGMGYEDIIII
jgi:pyruvate formate lyase activating enzyme